MSDLLAWRLVAILIGSFGVCALVILTQRWHGRLSLDHDLQAVQKLHHNPVPRIGGLGLLVGLLIAVAGGYLVNGQSYPTTLIMLVCAVPVFLAGLVEDLTKKVSVRIRLYASFVSAALAVWLLDAQLTNVDMPLLDAVLTIPAFSVAFTVFAVGGVTHSINIIDGLNGLAAGAVGLMLAGLAFIAWQAGDALVMKLCLWGIAAMAGFMLLNYPFGRIFLGDGGAYLAGFWLAVCAVLLLHRNATVSAWAVLLCAAYPAWETVYSMYRRNVRHRAETGAPDSVHLHHLIFRITSKSLGPQTPYWIQHGTSSLIVWTMVAACQIGAVASWNASGIAALLTSAFAAYYVLVYNSYFKSNGARPDHVDAPGHLGSSRV